jgi:hypothetical protein
MVTKVSDLNEQVQKFWSPLFTKELKEATLLPSLVNKEYQGSISRGGDTVYVSQISRPSAQIRNIGVDSDSFDSEKVVTTRIGIQANKRLVSAFEVEDLVDLQTQIESGSPEIRRVLLEAIELKLNEYVYSFVAPSASAPDHILSGVANFDASQLLSVRALASQAKWMKEKGFWLLLDPSYMNDVLGAQTLTSKDFIDGEAPVIGGQIANKRFGFNILEDNSAGMRQISPTNASSDLGLAFHPDFMHLVMGEPRFKISDQHAGKKFGYVISVDMWVGGALGIDGNVKHISIYNS